MEITLEQLGGKLASTKQFVVENGVGNLPSVAHLVAGKALNATMLSLLQKTNGGMLDEPDKAHLTLMQITIDEVMQVLPNDLDSVASFIDAVRAQDQATKDNILKRSEDATWLHDNNVGVQLMWAERISIAMHIAASLGMQHFMKQQGPSVVPKPYLEILGINVCQKLSSMFDLSLNKVTDMPTEVFDACAALHGQWGDLCLDMM
eukprot:7685770-Pyramimonas_sp.AAC.1